MKLPSPVVAVLGPRQCGKTTLPPQLVPAASANYFDLEDPISLARLDQPLTALGELRGTVVIDEVQRRPPRSGCEATRPSALSTELG